MKTVWKFPLKLTDFQTVKLPMGSRIISVLNQREGPVLYAEVESMADRDESWNIYTFGTGHPLIATSGAKFLGTLSFRDGSLIFHPNFFQNPPPL
jgi:hypothetical protein